MEKKTKEELMVILENSIEFKNKNQGILSVDSKKQEKEVIITSKKSIEEISFLKGDIITISIYFLHKQERIKEFEVI